MLLKIANIPGENTSSQSTIASEEDVFGSGYRSYFDHKLYSFKSFLIKCIIFR